MHYLDQEGQIFVSLTEQNHPADAHVNGATSNSSDDAAAMNKVWEQGGRDKIEQELFNVAKLVGTSLKMLHASLNQSTTPNSIFLRFC